jgi:hypothetical protein
MAAGSWTVFDKFKEYMGDGTIDMDNAAASAFKVYLATSSYTPDTTDQDIADLGAVEASNYTRPGLSTIAWSDTAGTTTWDCDDITITASGGTCTAKYAIIYYDSGAAADADRELVAYLDLDTGGGSIATATGNTLTIQIAATGVLQVS